MRGRVDVPGTATSAAVDLALTATVPDLTLMIADPDHAVDLAGTVRVDGVTAGHVPVAGTLRLLVPASRGATMDYELAFGGVGDRRWRLEGSKDVFSVADTVCGGRRRSSRRSSCAHRE